jgi:hypothetical protein
MAAKPSLGTQGRLRLTIWGFISRFIYRATVSPAVSSTVQRFHQPLHLSFNGFITRFICRSTVSSAVSFVVPRLRLPRCRIQLPFRFPSPKHTVRCTRWSISGNFILHLKSCIHFFFP